MIWLDTFECNKTPPYYSVTISFITIFLFVTIRPRGIDYFVRETAGLDQAF